MAPTADGAVLMRHGVTASGAAFRGRIDDPLTEPGWRQMRDAAAAVGVVDRVVSSPLARCRGFAAEFAAARAVPLAVEPRLREMDFGDWEGRTAAELWECDRERLEAFWLDPNTTSPPNGEPFADFTARVTGAWSELSAAGGSPLVVTHAGPIRVILARVRGLSFEEMSGLAVDHASLHRV